MVYRTPPQTAPAAGVAIAQHLIARGVVQAWVARQLGYDTVTFNRKLRGTRTERLTADDIRAIAAALEVPRATEAEWLRLLETAA